MVVAQLVERSLRIPEVRGSNPVIGQLFILNICSLSTLYWKDKNKEKEAVDGPFLKKDNKQEEAGVDLLLNITIILVFKNV